jgi:hypothetical protein
LALNRDNLSLTGGDLRRSLMSTVELLRATKRMPPPRRCDSSTLPDAPAPRRPLYSDPALEREWNLVPGTMRRARSTGKPPELASIPYLKVGHLVRYEPEVVDAAREKMRIVPGKAEP